MSKQKLIFTISFCAFLVFASGADMNPIPVTMLGTGIPMAVIAVVGRNM